MIKKLTAIGNSLGFIIEKPILELLKITKDTPLEVTTDGTALIIRPAATDKKERLRGIRGADHGRTRGDLPEAGRLMAPSPRIVPTRPPSPGSSSASLR